MHCAELVYTIKLESIQIISRISNIQRIFYFHQHPSTFLTWRPTNRLRKNLFSCYFLFCLHLLRIIMGKNGLNWIYWLKALSHFTISLEVHVQFRHGDWVEGGEWSGVPDGGVRPGPGSLQVVLSITYHCGNTVSSGHLSPWHAAWQGGELQRVSWQRVTVVQPQPGLRQRQRGAAVRHQGDLGRSQIFSL